MSRLTKFIARTLSLRLSLMVVSSIALLLMTALFALFYYSRNMVKEEAIHNANQALEGMLLHIDNVLLSVEQATGNIYFSMLPHLDDSEQMLVYSRKLVETNPFVVGCAIAFEPYFYPERGEYFMAYHHRKDAGNASNADSAIERLDSYGHRPYTEQSWYTVAFQTKAPYWTDPLKESETDGEPIMTYSIPIYDSHGGKVGVLAVDVSLQTFSDIILATKPSPHSYCTLLGRNGSYIVHPDTKKLHHQTVFTQLSSDTTAEAKAAAQEMLAGKTGYKPFRLDGQDYYVFYKPLLRHVTPPPSPDSEQSPSPEQFWSAGIVYPKSDITADSNKLLHIVLAITAVGLLILLTLYLLFTHHELKPLLLLTRSARRIADGNYNEPIPDSRQQDEIGQLQDHFQIMQQSLAEHINKLEHLNTTLQQQGKVLSETYEEAKEADRMKTAFLHNMSDQMMAPLQDIGTDSKTLREHLHELQQEDINSLVNNIEQKGKQVTVLLNQLLEASLNRQPQDNAYEDIH